LPLPIKRFLHDLLLTEHDDGLKLEHMSEQWIRASEIGDYLYCRRSWWLKRSQGVAAQNVRELARGSQHHQQHGRLVQQSVWLRRAAYALIFVVVALVAYGLMSG
jgi:hypothetical protein